MRFDLPDGEFVIPSGIVASTPDEIVRIAESADSIGVITTKSIGKCERDGYKEPIVAGIGGSLINAVGLSNPGVDAFAEEMASLGALAAARKHGKVVMASIFGGTENEFAEVASRIAPYADWLELNLSCPHASGYGATIGTKPDLVESVVKAVRGATGLPIFAKIVPSVGLAGMIARRAVEAGADGITAVNTVGPLAFSDASGNALLNNTLGGLSGGAIRDIALKCVADVRSAVDCPIIGMGGISSLADVEAFRRAGAVLFGVGTALWGVPTGEIQQFFKSLLSGGPPRAPPPLAHRRMAVKEAWGSDKGRVIVLDGAIRSMPGQFVNVWLPGVGEKPFSMALDSPAMLLVKAVGPVSSALCRLEAGSELMVRGPYGNSYSPSSRCILVAGGTGVAPIFFASKRFRERVACAYIGGRSEAELPLLREMCGFADVRAATEDGSAGKRCLVTDIMDLREHGGAEFLNCGPEAMLVRVADIESKVADPSRIFCIVERHSKCGIGICGSCSLDGYRTCVDGPVFTYRQLLGGRDFGRIKRSASGKTVSLRRG